MRKVRYKTWIPGAYNKESKIGGYLPNTNCWDKAFIHEGHFHCWGVSVVETNETATNYTVAIIENPDGTISEVLPTNVQFIN